MQVNRQLTATRAGRNALHRIYQVVLFAVTDPHRDFSLAAVRKDRKRS